MLASQLRQSSLQRPAPHPRHSVLLSARHAHPVRSACCRDRDSREEGDSPGCQKASSCVPEGSSRHQKGVYLGTAGGAEPPFTPTDSARTPWPYRMGMAARVRPGTSRCSGRAGGGKWLEVTKLGWGSYTARGKNILG